MAQSHAEDVRRNILERETTVYCSVFSQDGEYLVCGSSFGKICVWKISAFLGSKNWELNKPQQDKAFNPQLSFQAHNGPIYSIIIADSVLVSGGDEEIRVWKWSDLLIQVLQKSQTSVIPALPIIPTHELKTQQAMYSRGSLSMYAETNGLAYDHKRQYILGACGDNNCYIWDMHNNMQLVTRLHDGGGGQVGGYMHSVCAMPKSGKAATAGEDGCIKIWDTNTSQLLETIAVSSGKWVAAMAIDSSETWMVCGGGSKELVQYYLPTCTKSWGVATSGYTQSLLFSENKIVSTGNENYIYHYTFSGELIKKVHTSIPSVFSVAINRNSRKNQILIATGSSPTIDVYTPDYANVTTSLYFRY